MTVRCPKCDADLEVQEAEPDVGIMTAGAYCDACDLVADVEHESHEDDVYVGPTREPGEPLGTPISELSGRPGRPGFETFKRVAKSWGYD